MHHPTPRPTPRSASRHWLAGLVLALLASGPGLAFGQPAIPNLINYQGRLTDNLGNAVRAGSYQVTFKIWDSKSSPSDANYIWGCSLPVHVVTNGMFNVLLSDGVKVGNPKANNLLAAFEGDERYLGLTITQTPDGVVTQPEISPRQRLVSAPFAIHAYNASFAWQASNSITASNAAFASYAYYATNAGNAGKFSNLATSEFLLVNKPTQTVNGSLTINNGSLTLNSNLIANGNVSIGKTMTLSSNLVVNGKVGIGNASPNYGLSFASVLGDKINLWGTSGWHYGLGVQSRALQIHTDSSSSDIVFGYGESTNLIETVRMKGAGGIEVARTNPIVIRRFSVPNITAGVTSQAVFNTQFAWNEWSAVIAGFTFDGNIKDNNVQIPFLRVRMVPYGTSPTQTWGIDYFLTPESDMTGIRIDVMFIRRELTSDSR